MALELQFSDEERLMAEDLSFDYLMELDAALDRLSADLAALEDDNG